MQRFFLDKQCFNETQIVITDPDILHQMSRVLRMKENDCFIALDNNGFEFSCKIESLNAKKAEAIIIEKRNNNSEPKIFLTLYQALPKKSELFEWVLQKGTEIGISAFAPLITERTERNFISKEKRLLKILREACEQSERGKIPELLPIIKFKDAVNKTINKKIQILLHSRDNYPVLSSELDFVKSFGGCDLFVGPEGGFSENEISAAEKNEIKIYSLCPRIFRTETAGIAAASLILL